MIGEQWAPRIALAILLGSLVVALLRAKYKGSFGRRIARRERVLDKTRPLRCGHLTPSTRAAIAKIFATHPPQISFVDMQQEQSAPDEHVLKMRAAFVTMVRRKMASWLRSRVYCWHAEWDTPWHMLSVQNAVRQFDHETAWVFLASTRSTNNNNNNNNSANDDTDYTCMMIPLTELVRPYVDWGALHFAWPAVVLVFSNVPRFLTQ